MRLLTQTLLSVALISGVPAYAQRDVPEIKFDSWETIPQYIRILILEHITLTVQEVLNER